MAGQTGDTEKIFWSLEYFQTTHNGIPINVLSGRVAVKADLPACTEAVVCETHHLPLVPDLRISLNAQQPELIRRCPTPDCVTTATVGPFIYIGTTGVHDSLKKQKKAAADSYLQINGPAHKTHFR